MAVANTFADLEHMLEKGKRTFDQMYEEDLPLAMKAVEDSVTFVAEWVKEDMPPENKESSMLDGVVRQMIAWPYGSVAPELQESPEPKKEEVLVFADQAGLCQKILRKAPEGRLATQKVITKSAHQLSAQDLEMLLSKAKYDFVIFGCPLDPPSSNRASDIIAQQTAVDKLALHLLQTIGKYGGCCQRLAVLTHDIFSEQEDTAKQRGLSLVTGSTLYGLMNTARMEIEMPILLLDTEIVDHQEVIPELASEIFRCQTFGVNTVRQCWPFPVKNRIRVDRPHGRYVYRQVLSDKYAQAADKKWEPPEEGIIAITGGNGSLGLVFGRWLLDRAAKRQDATAGEYKPKFSIQLLSRSARVNEQNAFLWEQVQEKAAKLGVSVVQAKVDMGSQEAVDKFVMSVSPNLVGFIHSAGVLQDGMLMNQTWDKFETVYNSKHRPALYLHDSLERIKNPNLQFMWLFSSMASYGNSGQTNYSASNACLDSLARFRFASGLHTVSMHWGPWGEVGMASGLDDASRARFQKGPFPYFSVAQGIDGLEIGLRTGLPEFTTFLMNPAVVMSVQGPDQSATLRYARNWTSLMLPTPKPSVFDRSLTYDIYRMYRYMFAPFMPEDNNRNESIWWNKYMVPKAQPKEEEECDEIVSVDFL